VKLSNKSSSLVKTIEELVTDSVSRLGYNIVRVKLFEGKGLTLQVMIEQNDLTKGISVEDCEKVSHHISAILDVEDPIRGEYNLEVSSPGIDRPLVKLSDFGRFAGYEVIINTTELVNGRRKFNGKLVGVEANQVKINVPGIEEVVLIDFDNINNSKLVITNELIKKHKV
jgi:ribosome maturation factor RimP